MIILLNRAQLFALTPLYEVGRADNSTAAKPFSAVPVAALCEIKRALNAEARRSRRLAEGFYPVLEQTLGNAPLTTVRNFRSLSFLTRRR
jgi:hypothetical protein